MSTQEMISNIINGSNGLFTLALCGLVLFLLILCIKHGIISFSGKGFTVGIQNRERAIQRRQTNYIHGQVDAIANILLKQHPDFDEYKTKWICKCVELEWVRAIQYNHIENTEGYVDDRFETILAIIRKKADNDYFFTEDFEQFLRQHCKQSIKKFVEIRSWRGRKNED